MTLREIAKLIGVSPATVSLVVNDKPGISDKTRALVKQQLQQHGLYDQLKAQLTKNQLKTHHNVKQKNIVFVIVKSTGEILDSHPFFMLLMQYIMLRAKSYGYNVLLADIDFRGNPKEQVEYIKSLDAYGLLVFATEMSNKDLSIFDNISLPIVFLDNEFTTLDVNSVAINNEMATDQVINFLVNNNGIKKIGHLKSKISISSFQEREDGLKRALKKFNLQLDKTIEVRVSLEGCYQDLCAYLSTLTNEELANLPQAFIADDDTAAIAAIRAFSDFNINVPNDISLIGFNNRPDCNLSDPKLTTIDVNKEYLAMQSVDLLINLIDKNPKISIKQRVSTSLVARDSVRNYN